LNEIQHVYCFKNVEYISSASHEQITEMAILFAELI